VRPRCEHMCVSSELDETATLRCSRCEELKPASAFTWGRRKRGKRDTYCRPCRTAFNREHYLANRKRYIAAAKRRSEAVLAERMKFLVGFLLENPCVDCGEPDPLVLEFDHLSD